VLPGKGSAAGRIFLAPPYYSQHAVCCGVLWSLLFVITESCLSAKYSLHL